MATDESQGLKSNDVIANYNTNNISKVGDNPDHPDHSASPQSHSFGEKWDNRSKILLACNIILIAIIIVIVLCGVYGNAFAQYTKCDECIIAECHSIESDIYNVEIPDGNQYTFDHNVCNGYRNIWDDPSIPLTERNQIGRGIFQTPNKMQQAFETIKYGKMYELYRPYSHDMPFAFGRYLNSTLICGFYEEWDAGSCTQEIKTNGIGNIGTQFDSFGHFFEVDMENALNTSSPTNIDYVLFNNFRGNDVFNNLLGAGDDGVNYLGVNKLPSFFTRAILIDIAGYKEVEILNNKYGITADDFLNALNKQGLSVKDINAGDVVLIYTGWSLYIDTDPTLYYDWDETPGIMEEVITDILFDTNATIIGSDNWAVDALGIDEWGAHKIWLTCGGGFIHEMLKLHEWVIDARNGTAPWIGAYLFQPLPIKGGVAAAGKPVVFV